MTLSLKKEGSIINFTERFCLKCHSVLGCLGSGGGRGCITSLLASWLYKMCKYFLDTPLDSDPVLSWSSYFKAGFLFLRCSTPKIRIMLVETVKMLALIFRPDLCHFLVGLVLCIDHQLLEPVFYTGRLGSHPHQTSNQVLGGMQPFWFFLRPFLCFLFATPIFLPFVFLIFTWHLDWSYP